MRSAWSFGRITDFDIALTRKRGRYARQQQQAAVNQSHLFFSVLRGFSQ
jgi:DNA relaxase NicK